MCDLIKPGNESSFIDSNRYTAINRQDTYCSAFQTTVEKVIQNGLVESHVFNKVVTLTTDAPTFMVPSAKFVKKKFEISLLRGPTWNNTRAF